MYRQPRLRCSSARVAGGIAEPGGDGRLVAEVAGQAEHLEPRILAVHGAEDFEGVVGGAVVDENDLPGHIQRIETLDEAPPEQRNDLLLVEAGNDET